MTDRGSVSILLVALVALAVVLATLGVGVGTVMGGRVRAQAAADAAALAAAPVTFRPFGANGTPSEEAERFAARHGAALVACVCPINRSYDDRRATVEVALSLPLPIVGTTVVPAQATAEFRPIVLLVPDAAR